MSSTNSKLEWTGRAKQAQVGLAATYILLVPTKALDTVLAVPLVCSVRHEQVGCTCGDDPKSYN